MKAKALGRGLDALLVEIDEAYENEGTKQDEILELPLKDITPNPHQPRKIFNEESLQELANSIKKDGLLQPIIVKENLDGYTIIAGERRYRASKIAKLTTIRAIVINVNDDKVREFALLENIQRDDLNSIELAIAYDELIKLHNITHEELSLLINKSRTNITNTIRLLQLSSNTQKALLNKKITAGHAKVMIGLDEKEQEVIVNSIIGQKLSVRDVEAMAKKIKIIADIDKNHEQVAVFNLNSIKEKLSIFGFRVKQNKNKLTIDFNTELEVKDFLNHIS